ncbi:MAG TPA: hypothetical protein VGH20_02870 [Myxococcales bacterium]|jgi:hypothetical protein
MNFNLRNAVVIIAAGFVPLMASGCGGPAAGEASQAVAKSADVPTADLAGIAVLRGATPEMAEHHDLSAPLTLIPPAPRSSGIAEHPVKPIPRHFNRAPTVDPVLQAAAVTPLVPTALLNFNGVGNGFSGPSGAFTVASAPPDTNGDVGPNHYVQTVNTDFAVFNKSGTAVFGPVPINTLWSGFGGGCQTNNDGDPVVVYDPIADRWVISQFSVSTTPNLQCVAVSQTPDPTGAYFRYSFSYGTDFPDYPKMGVWPDAYYITFNIFANGATFAGARVCAYDRAKMLTGAAATQQCFTTSTSFGGLLPSDLDGARLPPAGAPNYIVGLGASASQLAYWKFHVDFTTPANTTFTGPTTLATAAYAEACAGGTCIPQSGTTQQLDSLADRVMFRLAYRNFGDHQALVTNHSITAGSSTGVRWYELRPDASNNLSIFQQGTYAPDTSFRWMGSIAQDQSGDIALGFSVSSSAVHPEIHYTARLPTDAAGTMTQGESTIINGAGSQTGQSLSRWGDYSNMVVDPVDDCTFWYTTEYIPANGAFNWSTRIGSFKIPGCGGVAPANDFSISATPATVSVVAGSSATSTIGTATVSGTAQTVSLSVSGAPAGVTASVSPASVTSGGSATLTITTTSAAAAGTFPLTVTGTAASGTHSTTVSVTVTAPTANNFSISASPASVSVVAGNSASSTISTATVSGAAQTVSLSVSGAPAGVTASVSPASVTSGGSATLTIATTTAAAAGTFTLTVTGTAASGSHSTTVSVTLTAAGGTCTTTTQLLANPGFETTASWTASAGVLGNAASGVHVPRTGTGFAWLDGYGTTHTDTLSQTVTIPATACTATLTFWVKIDTAETTTTTAFDKLTVAANTTTLTSLSNLNKSTAYVQKSFNLISFKGQAVTIKFTGTEDASLQTSFLIDDTAVTVTQ